MDINVQKQLFENAKQHGLNGKSSDFNRTRFVRLSLKQAGRECSEAEVRQASNDLHRSLCGYAPLPPLTPEETEKRKGSFDPAIANTTRKAALNVIKFFRDVNVDGYAGTPPNDIRKQAQIELELRRDDGSLRTSLKRLKDRDVMALVNYTTGIAASGLTGEYYDWSGTPVGEVSREVFKQFHPDTEIPEANTSDDDGGSLSDPHL